MPLMSYVIEKSKRLQEGNDWVYKRAAKTKGRRPPGAPAQPMEESPEEDAGLRLLRMLSEF